MSIPQPTTHPIRTVRDLTNDSWQFWPGDLYLFPVTIKSVVISYEEDGEEVRVTLPDMTVTI